MSRLPNKSKFSRIVVNLNILEKTGKILTMVYSKIKNKQALNRVIKHAPHNFEKEQIVLHRWTDINHTQLRTTARKMNFK